jgi:mono/diheme cytochrome c family protein
MRMRSLPLLLLAVIAVLAACSDAGEDGEAALVKRGKVVYQTNCTSCHARDPNQPGPVGPPIADASLELLTAKVLRNEYPPGYTPKRDTKAMVPLVHLKPELPAIAAYLESAKH